MTRSSIAEGTPSSRKVKASKFKSGPCRPLKCSKLSELPLGSPKYKPKGVMSESALAPLYGDQKYQNITKAEIAALNAMPSQPIPKFEHRFAYLAECSFVYEHCPFEVDPKKHRGRRPKSSQTKPNEGIEL